MVTRLKLYQNLTIKIWKKNSKTQIVTNLKFLDCDKTQKLKLWQYLKTPCNTTQNSNYDKTQKLKLCEISNTWVLKNFIYSNCDKTQILAKLKNSYCGNKNSDNTQIVTKLKLWQNLNYNKTQTVTKREKKNHCDKT